MKNFEIFDADIQLFTLPDRFFDIFPHFLCLYEPIKLS